MSLPEYHCPICRQYVACSPAKVEGVPIGHYWVHFDCKPAYFERLKRMGRL